MLKFQAFRNHHVRNLCYVSLYFFLLHFLICFVARRILVLVEGGDESDVFSQ
jgi:hypothetical protein